MPIKNDISFAYILSSIVIVLLLVSSIGGLLYGGRGFYDPDPTTLPQLYGQDVLTILIGIPLLIVSMLLTRRGSTRGLLLWMGALFYVVYSYFFYIVGVRFNPLFLVYITFVSMSMYALLGLLVSVDLEAIRARFSDKIPARLIGGFLIVMSFLFVLMWVGLVMNSLTAGTELDPVSRQVIAIDGTVLLPIMFVCGLWLWRRKVWGFLLAGLLLVKIATLGLTLVANTFLLLNFGQSIDLGQTVAFAVVMVGALILLIPYLRGVQDS